MDFKEKWLYRIGCVISVLKFCPYRLSEYRLKVISVHHYFCVDKSQSVSHKTLKVLYLAAIHLMHIENGFPDPTTDESLHLVCRGIHQQQSGSECTRLPITISLLKTLKYQLHCSQRSMLDPWTAFMQSFYGSCRQVSVEVSHGQTYSFRMTTFPSLCASQRLTLPERTINLHIRHLYNNMSSTSIEQLQ